MVLGVHEQVTITVTRSAGAFRTVSTDWIVTTSPRLQAPFAGTLTFLPGERTKTFTITAIPDTVPRLPQQFYVGLLNAKGAILGSVFSSTLVIAAHNNPYGLFTVSNTAINPTADG